MSNIDCVYRNTRSRSKVLSQPVVVNQIKWVSATHLYNYMINDTLVDWLKLRDQRGTRATPVYTSANGFSSFIMNQGNKFEDEIIKYINDNRLPVVSVSNIITDESCAKTIELMMQGVPVIHSAPVQNTDNYTRGVIDLLVRSDYLDRLVDECPITDIEMSLPSPYLNGKYHYVVIDIKFSTLPLRADGRHLLNSDNYPAYKAQTWIYNEAIGKIQGYTSNYSFIMGRRWKYTSKDIKYHNYTCLNKLGVIDYSGVDKEYPELCEKAIAWVRNVSENGDKWTVDPPSCKELYPNMCIDSGVWNSEKEKIAQRIKEITTIWYCGSKHRDNAIENGVDNWIDPNCTSITMGMKGVRANTIDNILNINRQDNFKVLPEKIKSKIYNWRSNNSKLYVDFETLSDIFTDFKQLPEQPKSDMIFMIGVGWEDSGIWKYTSFICKEPTYEEEYRIMDEFVSFTKNHGSPQLYHWHADANFWNTAENRQFDLADKNNDTDKKDHISDTWKLYDWADLAVLFREEPIVIKGCFNFKLKHVGKAMYNHKLIKTSLDSNCDSGMTAQINAWKCYKQSEDPVNSETMKDIVKYNEFDVKILWDILTYLRNNH